MGSIGTRDPQESISCPEPGQLVELARGALSEPKRREVSAHVKECSECGEVLRLWTGAEVDSAAGPSPSSGSGARRPPGPGDIIAAKYRVERVLGIGGMGMVVAATHLQLGRLVALKLMLPETAATKESAARFVQEAQAAADVQSEHVVRVLDVGSLDDGSPFMVMEYLRGSDFSRLLRTHGPLPVVDVAGYILQACEAVAEAHALGVVHRDLKPANLFLTARADGSPLVKVLDFGISKLARRGAPSSGALTKSRSILGTPLYMSPEQLRNTRSVGPGTDIWSLGCILYELLAARPPFIAETAEALGALIAAGPTPRIRQVRPEVPSALEDVIVRCLEKDPTARFGSVGELAQGLGPFAPAEMAPLVDRVGRISALPLEQLPFAETVHSDRPPRFSATGGALARSRSGAQGIERGTRLIWVAAGALAVGVGGLTFSRGWWRTAPAAPLSSAPATSTVATLVSIPSAPTMAILAPDAGLPATAASLGVAPAPSAVVAPKKPQASPKSVPSSPAVPVASSRRPTTTPPDRDAIE